MIRLRRGVGSDSRNRQIAAVVGSGDSRGRFMPEHRVGDGREQREQRRDDDEPEPGRLGDGRDIGREQRRDPQDQRVHRDEEQTHRREQEPTGERDDDRAG